MLLVEQLLTDDCPLVAQLAVQKEEFLLLFVSPLLVFLVVLGE
jgi:hypothetical protein